MSSLDVIEAALVAPSMESVIAVTERYQYLEIHRDAKVFTAYREVDHMLFIGFAQALSSEQRADFEARGFVLFGEREGTQREHRLLLMTLEEIGISASYGPEYFVASRYLLRHLRNLGWPLGDLKAMISGLPGSKDGTSPSR